MTITTAGAKLNEVRLNALCLTSLSLRSARRKKMNTKGQNSTLPIRSECSFLINENTDLFAKNAFQLTTALFTESLCFAIFVLRIRIWRIRKGRPFCWGVLSTSVCPNETEPQTGAVRGGGGGDGLRKRAPSALILRPFFAHKFRFRLLFVCSYSPTFTQVACKKFIL